MTEDFLEGMARSSRERSAKAQSLVPAREMQARALATSTPPELLLSAQFDLIAEVKLRSPAMGQLRGSDDDIAARVGGYAHAGAAAISVLTEPSRFEGSMDHLSRAVAAIKGGIPVMRKDFLVDAYQVHEARAAGAGGVLIILRMLSRDQLRTMLDACVTLKLFALLEAFDEADLQLANALVQEYAAQATLLVGINCRDLVTLKVVPGRLEELAPLLPAGVARVAESGVTSAEDAARLVRCGYDAALVGSALMQSRDALGLARAMLKAGREAACHRCG
jgi:indole-3-glycerol phosphate synthase